MKRCTMCNQDKPDDAFSGLHRRCKPCRVKQSRIDAHARRMDLVRRVTSWRVVG